MLLQGEGRGWRGHGASGAWALCDAAAARGA